MKLLTKANKTKLLAQDPHHETGPGRELSSDDLIVIAKFFTPDSNWTWYAVSISNDPDSDPNSDAQFFGLVDGFEPELGYFWLSELESVTGPLGLHIERDLYWTPRPLSEVKAEVDIARQGISPTSELGKRIKAEMLGEPKTAEEVEIIAEFEGYPAEPEKLDNEVVI